MGDLRRWGAAVRGGEGGGGRVGGVEGGRGEGGAARGDDRRCVREGRARRLRRPACMNACNLQRQVYVCERKKMARLESFPVWEGPMQRGLERCLTHLLHHVIDRTVLPWEWFAILNIRATSRGARDHAWSYLRPALASLDIHEASPSAALGKLQDAYIQADLNLLRYISECANRPGTRICSGGYALLRLLKEAHPKETWRQGDVDVFVRASKLDDSISNGRLELDHGPELSAVSRETSSQIFSSDGELYEAVKDTVSFFQSRGYSVTGNWSLYGGPDHQYTFGDHQYSHAANMVGYPKRANQALFAQQDLERGIRAWIDKHGASETPHLLPEIERVFEFLPTSRREREWVVFRGGIQQMYVRVRHEGLGVRHESALRGLEPRILGPHG